MTAGAGVCRVGAAVLMLVAGLGPALAEDGPGGEQTERPQHQSAVTNARQAIGADEIDGPTILEGVPALNSVDAFRDRLRDRFGVYFHGQYVGDPYANVRGGLRQGATYSGRLAIQLDIDAAKLVGVRGGTLHADMFQIHGRDLSAEYIGNLLTTNDIAALPTTRLYGLWYEQALGDRLAVRVGQQGVDVEFLTSNYGANFINASFGWPGLPSQNLPDGGPAYPLAAPAARLKFDATPQWSLLAAVFDGKPAGPCAGDPQTCDRNGVNFRISDPPLVLAESQYRYNQGEDAAGLPGTFKLGAFAQFGPLEANGIALNAAGGDVQPPVHARNVGVYAVVDQQIYRLGKGDDTEVEKGVGVFARIIGAPSDRNPVDFYADGGFSALGLVPGHPDDLFGLAGIFERISSSSAAASRDSVLGGMPGPVRDFEAVVEATYQAQIVPGFVVQPTFQYIFHPGGHALDPYGKGAAIPDAAVFGTTLSIRF